MRTFTLVALLATLFAGSLVSRASAQNLVSNGGFETGDFTDWTIQEAAAGTFLLVANYPAVPHTGEYGAIFAASRGADDSITQLLTTQPAATYTLSFWLQGGGTIELDNAFSVLWNGSPVLALSNAVLFPYTEYTFEVTAAGNSTPLTFSGRNTPASFVLDDVSVTLVPEPSTGVLAGLCAAGLLVIKRRRRAIS